MQVFVLDRNRQPLDPCSPARARILLARGRAVVFRRYPFTILLKDRTVAQSVVHPHRLKIDPGARTTGMALVQEPTGRVLAALEITHRGPKIQAALVARRALRRSRRQRKTRYRPSRFANRRRRPGWLPPSLESRLANILTWVARLCRLGPITALSQELIKFDLQALENPEISGVEYQQGTLAGYELREYLLEKWRRTCAYCGKTGVPLQIDHIQPRSRGGTNRVINLTLACAPCNRRKADRPVEEFLKRKPAVLARLLAQAQAPLKDATAVNATRWELFRRLEATGLPVACGSGGQTKYNRTRQGLPKTHWLDAACVGASTPERLVIAGVRPLWVAACGHGCRQQCRTDRHGFPSRHKPRAKRCPRGFCTGDIGRAVVPGGKYQGVHTGRLAIRFRGYHQVGTVPVNPAWIKTIHRADGYGYALGVPFHLPAAGGAAPPHA
jgi:5-methylcytosine-specific restriction endonuclease McrA